MLDCFLDYSVNPNLRFHSRIDKIIDDVIREKINIAKNGGWRYGYETLF